MASWLASLSFSSSSFVNQEKQINCLSYRPKNLSCPVFKMASIQHHNFFTQQCRDPERLHGFREKRLIIICGVKCRSRDSSPCIDTKKPKLLIAGGGIGGLVLAVAAKRSGVFDVKVFEKESSAVRGEGTDRGPIQLLSSALSVLESIDRDVATEIMEAGCVTGDRDNGIADGMTGEWFVNFDFLSPAIAKGFPVTRIICRMELQRLLMNAVGTDTVISNSKVVDFISDANKVTVFLENGKQHVGDVLVGADGIRSMVRSKLFGPDQEPKYSNFTCYTAITKFYPKYFGHLGFKIFIGTNQYFVVAYIGKGRMQWYAFVKEPHQSLVSSIGNKTMLVERFGDWCKEVVTSICETPEDLIIRRPIYDTDMVNTWSRGRVILLGDAAHAMLPNLGQGGSMAIEDSHGLMVELQSLVERHPISQISPDELALAFKRFEKKRMFRVSTLHKACRIASSMTSLYHTYIDIGPLPLFNLSTVRVKNPGLVIPNKLLQVALPKFVNWVVVGRES